MAPEPESKTVEPPSPRAQVNQTARRGGRSGRRRRSRRGHSQPRADGGPAGSQEGPRSEMGTQETAAASRLAETDPSAREATTAHRQAEPQRAPRSALQKAIDEVNQIVVTLRGALDDMEEVFETLEVAERQ